MTGLYLSIKSDHQILSKCYNQQIILMESAPNLEPIHTDPTPPNNQIEIFQTNPIVQLQQPVKQLTCMDRATNMVDQVTGCLYLEIISGLQKMHRPRPILSKEELQTSPKNKSIVQQKTVDVDEHKRMIRKFMRMNKKSLKFIQQRSIQFEDTLRKVKEDESKRRDEQRNKTLEFRRQRIAQRLKTRDELVEQIRRSVLQSNKKLSTLKNKKLLYQERQQNFKRQYQLPKIEEQRRILMKKKEQMRPMNMTLIMEHQQKYEQKRINDRLNRSFTSRVLQNQNQYSPPKFVPKSFLILQAEEELKKQEGKLKSQQAEMNQYRKKQFLKAVEQRKKQQSEKAKEKLAQKSQRKSTIDDRSESIKKERQIILRNREQTRKIGDDYMKQLISLNRKKKSRPAMSEFSSEKSIQTVKQKTKTKSLYEIQLIKEERIEKIQKIRFRKIENLVNNESIDSTFKIEQLKQESEKFDRQITYQKEKSIDNSADMASLVLSSIHTKLAILQVASPRKGQ